jgi:hypothetical protein
MLAPRRRVAKCCISDKKRATQMGGPEQTISSIGEDYLTMTSGSDLVASATRTRTMYMPAGRVCRATV